MNGTRREALRFVAGALGTAALGPLLVSGQASHGDPSRAPAGGDSNPDPSFEAKRTKALLEQNQKDMKKNIERLYQLATELKDEVEKTDATTTLSLAMLRKTEEIEKLAHQIRDRAKG
jgi:hypothetical protein